MNRKTLWFFTISVLILLSACRQKPLELAFVGPLSGRYSDMGTECRNGILLAVEEWNELPQRKGPPISLNILDDQNDPEIARTGFIDFLDQGIEIIIGPMTSTLSLAVVDLLEDPRRLFISPTASTIELSGLDDGFYRLVEAYIQEGKHLSRYAREVLGLSRMAVVYDSENAAYSKGWLASLAEDFTSRGGILVDTVVLDLSQEGSHYNGAVELLEADPDVVVLALPGLDAGLISQQIAILGGDVQLMLSTWAKDSDLIPYGGSAVEGAFFTEMFREDSQIPAYLTFKEHYRQRFGDNPEFSAALGYESLLAVQAVLENHKRGESYRETLARVGSFTGLQGEVAFDAYGDILRNHHYGIIKDGEFKYLEQ